MKYPAKGIDPQNILHRFLDTDGDGTGTTEIAADHSGGETFKITAPAGEAYSITRMIVFVRDNATLTAAGYGALSELSNGVELGVYDDTGTRVLNLTPVPVTSNAGWAGYCYDVETRAWGGGDNALSARWTFAATGSPIVLPPGYELRAEFSDDLSGLVSHTIMVQGTRQT